MTDFNRFKQCFSCKLLDHCKTDSDDKDGSCTRYMADDDFVEIADNMNLESLFNLIVSKANKELR